MSRWSEQGWNVLMTKGKGKGKKRRGKGHEKSLIFRCSRLHSRCVTLVLFSFEPSRCCPDQVSSSLILFLQCLATTVISQTTGCCVRTPNGQRTCWLKGRISTGGELLGVLTTTGVRTNPEVQVLQVVAQDPGNEQTTEAAHFVQSTIFDNARTTVKAARKP